MASSGSISGASMSPLSTAPHMESPKWLVMMYLWASQCLGLYLRSVALVRVAELPLLLVADGAEARWARSWLRLRLAPRLRPRFFAMLAKSRWIEVWLKWIEVPSGTCSTRRRSCCLVVDAGSLVKPAYVAVYERDSGDEDRRGVEGPESSRRVARV